MRALVAFALFSLPTIVLAQSPYGNYGNYGNQPAFGSPPGQPMVDPGMGLNPYRQGGVDNRLMPEPPGLPPRAETFTPRGAPTAAEQGWFDEDETRSAWEMETLLSRLTPRQQGRVVPMPRPADPVKQSEHYRAWLSQWRSVLISHGVGPTKINFEANRLDATEFAHWATRQMYASGQPFDTTMPAQVTQTRYTTPTPRQSITMIDPARSNLSCHTDHGYRNVSIAVSICTQGGAGYQPDQHNHYYHGHYHQGYYHQGHKPHTYATQRYQQHPIERNHMRLIKYDHSTDQPYDERDEYEGYETTY